MKSENLVGRRLFKHPLLLQIGKLSGMGQAERRMLMMLEREERLRGNGKKAESFNS